MCTALGTLPQQQNVLGNRFKILAIYIIYIMYLVFGECL